MAAPVARGECVLIHAYAGTGKTTTLQLLANAHPSKRILYVCFNRETAEQARKRFPQNADCRTIHSLAYTLHGGAYRHKLGTPRPLDVMRALGITEPFVAVYVIQTVQRFLHGMDHSIQPCHVPPECIGWDSSPERIANHACELWRLMQDCQSPMAMSHDGYLKLWAMTMPRLAAYDMIFLDEAQDTNPVTLDVILRQRLYGRASLVFVGDTHQSIYRWRHAVNAMEQMRQVASATFPLTVSFRFGSDIAEDASFLLNEWKDDMVHLVGQGPASNPMGMVATIGRTNGAVIGAAIQLATEGKQVHFAGTSESEGWSPFIPYNLQVPLDLLALKSGERGKIQSPYIRSFESFEQVVEHARGNGEGRGADAELASQVGLVEKHGRNLPEAIRSLCQLARSPREASMSFSTAHRAKGLEWRDVYLLGDFLTLLDLDPQHAQDLKRDATFLEEINLIYVAMSRACALNHYPHDLRSWLSLQREGHPVNGPHLATTTTKPTTMNEAEWVIIDTETDGLQDPIHVVEIAAQRMRGWEPVGERFRILLNHEVPIPSAAVDLHGYDEGYLRAHGEDPVVAHTRFREYVGGLPLISHNLSFDWNRALFPEWLRLGLEPAGQRGFCSLMLSRRVIGDCKSYRLDVLRTTFCPSLLESHRAFADVGTLVSLFGSVFRPRLEASGLVTLESVADFSRRTPVAKCLGQVSSPKQGSHSKPGRQRVDQWYFLDAQNEAHGPLTASDILHRMGAIPCWVWQEGLPDWSSSERCEPFLECLKVPPPLPMEPRVGSEEGTRRLQELIGLCRGLIADGKITTAEVKFLSDWLRDAGVISEWPATEIADLIERITADGHVSKEEKLELLALLQRVCK